MTTKNCRHCGNEFTATNNAQGYCPQCQKEKRRKPRKVTLKIYTCEWCGTEFVSGRKKKYCCRACQLHTNRGKSIKRQKAKNFMSIEEVARESRKLGMSAGEYMAKYCYGKEG